MPRLSSLKSSLPSLASSVAYAPKDEQERDRFRDQQHWRKWYRTARWKKLRWAVLLLQGFTCTRCGKLEGDTSQLVADHVKPHRGDEALFWDENNLTCICKPCHDGAKQREERAGA
jgi:5-methylcytosine-specific restriction protein A